MDDVQVTGQTPGQKAAADLDELTKNPVQEDSLANVVEEFEERRRDFQAAYNAGGSFKERLDMFAKEKLKPREVQKPGEMVEIPTTPEVGKEIEGYMQRVEKELELAGPVMDDYTQQVLLKPAAPQTVKVTLPLTTEEIEEGLHHKVWEAIAWLARWCKRQLEMLGTKR